MAIFVRYSRYIRLQHGWKNQDFSEIHARFLFRADRVCVRTDAKPLNTPLRRDHCPILLNVADMLREFAQAKVFCAVHVKSAFCHLERDAERSKLTTLMETPVGNFR